MTEWLDPTTAPMCGTPFEAKSNRYGYVYTCIYDAESSEWEIRLPNGDYGGSCIPDAWRPLEIAAK